MSGTFISGTGPIRRVSAEKKGGKFEFRRWCRYVEAAVLVRLSPVFDCQVLPGGDQVLPGSDQVFIGVARL